MAIIRNTLYITYCVDVVYARRKQRPTTCICYIGLRGLYLDFWNRYISEVLVSLNLVSKSSTRTQTSVSVNEHD